MQTDAPAIEITEETLLLLVLLATYKRKRVPDMLNKLILDAARRELGDAAQ
jgi:hypothetical protein